MYTLPPQESAIMSQQDKSKSSQTLNFRLTDDYIADLDELAGKKSRKRANLIAFYIKEAIDRELWEQKCIQERLKEANDPNTKWISHEEMELWFKDTLAKNAREENS